MQVQGGHRSGQIVSGVQLVHLNRNCARVDIDQGPTYELDERRLSSGAVRARGTSRSGKHSLLPQALAPTVQTYSELPNGSRANVLMPGCEGHIRRTQRKAAI